MRRFVHKMFAGKSALDIALMMLVPYTLIGVAYALFNIEFAKQLEHVLNEQITIFPNIAALLMIVALWPLFLVSSLFCGVAGCGAF